MAVLLTGMWICSDNYTLSQLLRQEMAMESFTYIIYTANTSRLLSAITPTASTFTWLDSVALQYYV